MKPFTEEGRVECGFYEVVAGKTYAFTPVVRDGYIGLGVAVANEPGYYPIAHWWCHAETWGEMVDHCDALNLELGLDQQASAIIVASSMAAQNRKLRTPL